MDTNDLSSDHSAIIANLSTYNIAENKTYKVISPKTNLNVFNNWLETHINLNVRIKDGCDLDNVVEDLTNLIHEAAFVSTPVNTTVYNRNKVIVSAEIRDLIRIKRRLRRLWKQTRNPLDKTNLNRASNELKQRLNDIKNEELSYYLRNLTPNNKRNEYNLWNATKYLKRPTKRNIPVKNQNGSWCKNDLDKAVSFSQHLETVFQPFSLNNSEDLNMVTSFLDSPCQMDLPIRHISHSEVENEIAQLNNKKAPGYDKISGKDIKSLPKKAITLLTTIFNSILRLNYFPAQWKCAEIIMLPKPNKPENSIKSYRPISLLSTFSKIFEKIFLRRMQPILEDRNIIPEHQFGFRHKHGTPEQCHRVVNTIRHALENKQYCSAIFLDIQQAFDRVWHLGVLFKLKQILPAPYYLVLKSYLENRYFYVRVRSESSGICEIKSGVPQGSVLGPVLYTIFTSDMPVAENITIATYADDTALLTCNDDKREASNLIQTHLNIISIWLKKCNIYVCKD